MLFSFKAINSDGEAGVFFFTSFRDGNKILIDAQYTIMLLLSTHITELLMPDKILGIVSFGLCAASQVLIRHSDTALFFGFLFFGVGAYEFVVGEIRQRRNK